MCLGLGFASGKPKPLWGVQFLRRQEPPKGKKGRLEGVSVLWVLKGHDGRFGFLLPSTYQGLQKNDEG